MLANVTCPACRHRYWLQEAEMGSGQICPNCQSPFFAGASEAVSRPASGPTGALQAGYAKTMIGESIPAIKYSCPRCKAALEAPAEEAGTKKNCPNCAQRLQVPAPPKPEPAAAAPNLNKTMLAGAEPPAPPRPPIKYNCPNCKKPLESPAEQGGTKRACPACNQRLQIPAAVPIPSNRNKTMLASEDSAAPANASSGVAAAEGVRGSGSAVAGPAPAVDPWAALLTPRNVILAVVALLLLALVVPAVFRGGKTVDTEALAQAKLEVERLKMEIELKKAEMDRQAKAQAEAAHKVDEEMTRRRLQDERNLADQRRQLREIEDDDRRAALEKKFKQEQQQREADRLASERKSKEMLEDASRKLEETKRALEASQQKQQTIIQAPPPVVYYPPYSPRYYYPPWW